MKTRFFTLAALALALVACNNDNENLNGDPVAAQFTADIAPATRASGTTWTAGDRIGITDIGNDSQYGNVPFILKNGKFEAEGKVIYIEDTKTHRIHGPRQPLPCLPLNLPIAIGQSSIFHGAQKILRWFVHHRGVLYP